MISSTARLTSSLLLTKSNNSTKVAAGVEALSLSVISATLDSIIEAISFNVQISSLF